MSAAIVQPGGAQPAVRAQIGEWFWRFLAVVMLVVVAWVVWIAIQISPPEMVLPAAYEAAAQGRALRNSGGVIAPSAQTLPGSPAAAPVAAPAAPDPGQTPVAVPVAVSAPAMPVEPPVNLEKLRLADSIETPIFERTRRRTTPVPDSAK
jgi:hypothetical protein